MAPVLLPAVRLYLKRVRSPARLTHHPAGRPLHILTAGCAHHERLLSWCSCLGEDREALATTPSC